MIRSVVKKLALLLLLMPMMAWPASADDQASATIFMSVYIQPETNTAPASAAFCLPSSKSDMSSCEPTLVDYSVVQQGSDLHITVEPI